MNKNNSSSIFFYEKIPLILTSLLPLLLITGSFLPDLAIVICGLLFIINSWKKKLFKYYNNYFFYGFLIFNFFLIISSLLSSHVLISLKSSVFYMRFCFFALSTWWLLDENPKIVKYLLYSFSSAIILLFLDSCVQFFSGFNVLGYPYQANRISSFFKDELIMGSYVSRTFPFFIGLFFFYFKKKKNILYSNFFFILIFCTVPILVVLSQERASLFYLILYLFYILILEFKKVYKLFIAFFVIILFLILFVPQLQKRLVVDSTNQIFNIHEKENNSQVSNKKRNVYIFSKLHEQHFESALRMFKSNPIFGVGPHVFRWKCNLSEFKVSEHSCTTHPHNTYIQLLAETGFVGFFFISLIFFYLIIRSINIFYAKYILKINNTTPIYQISFLGSLLITLWPLIPSGSFFHNWLVIIYYLPVGFILSLNQNKILFK